MAKHKRGKGKSGKGRRSSFARFVRSSRKGCPTPKQIRREWKKHQKERAYLKKHPMYGPRRPTKKQRVAQHYASSAQSGSNWWNPFGPQGDPRGRKRKGKRGGKRGGRRGGKKFKAAARLWQRFTRKYPRWRKLAKSKRTKLWKRFSGGKSKSRGRRQTRFGKTSFSKYAKKRFAKKRSSRKGRKGKRSGWNTFFAKHRRRGMKPKAIGRAWRKAGKVHHRKGRKGRR